jgi:hypothetical protein
LTRQNTIRKIGYIHPSNYEKSIPMKKTISLTVFLSLLFLLSCKKDNSNGAYGSWTLNGISYKPTVFSDSLPLFPGIGVSNDGVALQIFFYHGLPTTSGTYHVINADSVPTSADQVSISAILGSLFSNYYNSTGAGSNQIITVTISGGKLTASGGGINMLSSAGTATLGFDIHQ